VAGNKQLFSRNILVPQVGAEGQKKISSSSVLVAGCGGLGSTVIANLCGLGVKRIGIIDDDVLELANLNRQHIHKISNIGKIKTESASDFIENYHPEIQVDSYKIRLNDKTNFDFSSEYDFVIDCFDSFKSKLDLNRQCVKHKKTLIHGGVTEFYGQVAVIIPKQTACLACLITVKEDEKQVIKGVLSPAVTAIASIQSMEAVKIMLGQPISLAGRILFYDGLRQKYKKIDAVKLNNCKVCS